MFEKVYDPEWIKHWMTKLLSDETIEKYDFIEWLDGCESSYKSEELKLMEYFYKKRRYELCYRTYSHD